MTNIRNALMQAAGSASGDKVYVEDVFSTHLYTGNGSNGLAIDNGIDLDGEGGLVWIKGRTSGGVGSDNHSLATTDQGLTHQLASDLTNGNIAWSNMQSFDDDGFTLTNGGTTNTNGVDYVSWTFRKQAGFFDVVKFSTTGGGGTQAVSHSLGSIPGFIIIKKTSAAQSWFTFHKSVTSPNSNWWRNFSDLTTAAFDDYFSDNSAINSAPTSTAVTVGSYFTDQTADFIMYVFAEGGSDDQIFGDDGDEAIIKCGTYTTDGTGVNSSIDVGFEPQWLMVKRSDSTSGWVLIDNMRGWPSVGTCAVLEANDSDAEATSSMGLNSKGFKDEGSFDANATMVYVAIRRGPMKEPSAGTDVYTPVRPSSSGTFTAVSGFPTDLTINKGPSNGDTTYLGNRLTGVNSVAPTSTAAQFSVNFAFNFMNQITIGGTGDYSSWISWNFRRYPKVFDTVVYEGNGNNSPFRQITHNLGVAPELVIIKNVDQALHWGVNQNTGDSDVDADVVYLNLDGAYSGGSGLTASATTVTLNGGWGGTAQTNGSGDTHLMLMFASLSGISKVGAYVGTGNDLNVTDLGAAARFVLIKRTDATGDWYVFDTVTGIVSGNEAYNFLNSDTGVQTAADYIDPHSSGFTITSSAPDALNASGGKYLYLAFA